MVKQGPLVKAFRCAFSIPPINNLKNPLIYKVIESYYYTMGTINVSDKAKKYLQKEASRIGFHEHKPISLTETLDLILFGDNNE